MKYLRNNASHLVFALAVLAASFFHPAFAMAGFVLATRRSAKKKGITVNFDGVEAGGFHVPEGDYLLEVAEVEQLEGKESGEPYLKFTFEIAEGDKKGKKIFHNCSLQPQALFNLRNVLEALDVEIPKGAMEIDPEELVGLTCGSSLQTETYEGKKSSRPVEFFPASELEGDPKPGAGKKKDDEPAPAKGGAKKKKAAEPEFEVGQKVKFTDDEKEEQQGKITEIDGDTATVKVGRDEWEISTSELEPA